MGRRFDLLLLSRLLLGQAELGVLVALDLGVDLGGGGLGGVADLLGEAGGGVVGLVLGRLGAGGRLELGGLRGGLGEGLVGGLNMSVLVPSN